MNICSWSRVVATRKRLRNNWYVTLRHVQEVRGLREMSQHGSLLVSRHVWFCLLIVVAKHGNVSSDIECGLSYKSAGQKESNCSDLFETCCLLTIFELIQWTSHTLWLVARKRFPVTFHSWWDSQESLVITALLKSSTAEPH